MIEELVDTLEPYTGRDEGGVQMLRAAVYVVRSGAVSMDEVVEQALEHYSQDYIDSGDGGSSVWVLKDDEYFAHADFDGGDIWVEKSPWVTRADYCSPCAPGAGYLGSCETNYDEDGELNGDCWAYCLGPEFFDNDNPCPYVPVKLSEVLG